MYTNCLPICYDAVMRFAKLPRSPFQPNKVYDGWLLLAWQTRQRELARRTAARLALLGTKKARLARWLLANSRMLHALVGGRQVARLLRRALAAATGSQEAATATATAAADRAQAPTVPAAPEGQYQAPLARCTAPNAPNAPASF